MRKSIRAAVSAAAVATAMAVVTAASSGTAFAQVGAPSFTEGASGFNVYCAQMAMFEDSMDTSTTPDGDFGPQTLAAVIAFQKREGLQPDGEVGPLTGSAMWQMISWDIQKPAAGGNFMTPWGIPISHCYQVLPTNS